MQAETPNLIAESRARKWDKPVTYVRNECMQAMRVDRINFPPVAKNNEYTKNYKGRSNKRLKDSNESLNANG